MKRSFSFLAAIFALAAAAFPAERIVTLGTYATENLVLLGLGDRIVGVTLHEREELKRGKEIIGTLWEPNIEKIISLQPDIVVASKEGNRKEAVKKLERHGLKIFLLDEITGYENVRDNLLLLGRKFGKKQVAEEILAKTERDLTDLRNAAGKTAVHPKVFFALGWKPLVTTGNRSYLDEMVRIAGGTNIFGEMKKKYFNVSREEVVKRNPDVVIYLSMGERDAPELKQLFPGTAASAAGKIFFVDAAEFGSPTPVTYVNSIKKIATLLAAPRR